MSNKVVMRQRKLVVLVSLAVLANAAVAEERVTVTAAKREQTLQDVPISVSVTSQETLQQAHITDIIDLQSVIPSLKVSQANAIGQTNFTIRGFGNGSGNDGIESAVGVFVDGVYRSRTSSAMDDLPEVERIEVLRGPQSTIFGKNVSAGAITIITAKPKFTHDASAEVSLGNFNSQQEKVMVTGPISDALAFRISASNNSRVGYLTNSVTNHDVNDRDRQSVRADFLYEPTKKLSVRVIADYNEINEVCCGTAQLKNGAASAFIAGNLGAVSNPANKFDDKLNFNTDPVNHLTGQGLSAQVDWKADIGTLTSITAYRQQGNRSQQDVDFTGADITNKDQHSNIDTFSQEFRLTSTGKGPFQWMTGAYYQHESLDYGVDTTFGTQTRAYTNALSGGAITAFLDPTSTLYFQAGQGIHDFYKMKQDSYSVFGNMDFSVTDRLTLTGGLAYLHDRKRAASDVVLTDKFSKLAFVGPLAPLAGLNALQFFYGNTANHGPVNYPNAAESGELTGSKVTKTLKAAFDFDVVNVYVSYTTGWKAGAYNLSSDARPPNAQGYGRTAKPENVELKEIGLKGTFQGGFYTVAIFDQTIKDFQTNAYTGTGYNLVNAEKESSRGVELDGAFKPAEWLSITGAVTYLDPKYDRFTKATCASFDTTRCGLGQPSRDLSGTKPSGIPTWTASTSATVSREIGAGFTGYIRAEYTYVSLTALADNTPPDVSSGDQKNVNMSFGLINKPQKYEAMLWVRNLTDHRTITAAFPTVAQSGSYSGFVNLPRMFGATFRIHF